MVFCASICQLWLEGILDWHCSSPRLLLRCPCLPTHVALPAQVHEREELFLTRRVAALAAALHQEAKVRAGAATRV
jgi:hypothetical protein